MPIYEYVCPKCGLGPIERYEPLVDSEEPPTCGPCCWEMKKIPSVSFAQHFGEGAYAASRHGSQWRNQWGRKFKRDNEGENFNATKHVRQMVGGKNA